MRVLIVGGGGREHALAWKLRKDDPALELIAAPGNPGIAELGECVAIPITDLAALEQLARDRKVDLTIVGPEAPLEAGIVDRFRAAGLPIFGPTKAAAEIETSKAFAKTLMLEDGIPTARAEVHTTVAEAKSAARRFGAPVVVKASGLAAGKGVIVCKTLGDADSAIDDILEGNRFGAAGAEVAGPGRHELRAGRLAVHVSAELGVGRGDAGNVRSVLAGRDADVHDRHVLVGRRQTGEHGGVVDVLAVVDDEPAVLVAKRARPLLPQLQLPLRRRGLQGKRARLLARSGDRWSFPS